MCHRMAQIKMQNPFNNNDLFTVCFFLSLVKEAAMKSQNKRPKHQLHFAFEMPHFEKDISRISSHFNTLVLFN